MRSGIFAIAIETQDLPSAIAQMVEQIAASTPMQVTIELEGEPCPLLPAVELNLLRIKQHIYQKIDEIYTEKLSK